jgi:hypothetical protein
LFQYQLIPPQFKAISIMKEKPCKETLEKWHKDPNNWKLGIFYYNKEDKRILPPKESLGPAGQLISPILFRLPFCDCNYHNNWNNITPPK